MTSTKYIDEYSNDILLLNSACRLLSMANGIVFEFELRIRNHVHQTVEKFLQYQYHRTIDVLYETFPMKVLYKEVSGVHLDVVVVEDSFKGWVK